MDEAEYVSFDLFLQSNFRLSELGFDPRTCLNAHSFALFVFIPFLFLPAYFPLHALMSGWASSKDIHYRNTELIPPLNLFAFSLVSLLLSLFLSLYTTEQDKPQQGAGSWKSAEWRQPFLPSGGEKRFIYPDPQNNFPRISRGEPAFSWITNRAFARGKEFTLTLSLYAFSPQIFRLLLESPTEFIANFWGDPLCGKKERRRSVQ